MVKGSNQRERQSRKKGGRRYHTIFLERGEFMGIDWGKSDVGVALADAENRIAYAYATLENDRFLLEKLERIIKEKGVKKVIIGIPSQINRPEVEYAGERLGETLEQNLGVTVEYQNEMFTTAMAQRQLIDRGVRAIERYDDQEAARIILQDWLDQKVLSS
jgi:putative transcription antitermination factor YqgF